MNEEIIKNLKDCVNELEQKERKVKYLLNVLDHENNKFYIVILDNNKKNIYECPICKNNIFHKYKDHIDCEACGITITLHDFLHIIYFRYSDFTLSDILKLIK